MANGCVDQPIKNPFSKEKPLPSERARSRPLPVYDDPVATAPVARLTVNHESVRASDLWKGETGTLEDNARRLPAPAYQEFVQRRAAQLITDRIAEMLLYQAAAVRLGPNEQKVFDRLVDEQLRKIISAEYGGVQRRMERHLESTGQSLQEYRLRLRREMIIARFLELELKPKVAEPTRAELVAFYDQNAAQWRRNARRSMSLIDVRVMDRLPDSDAQPTREEIQAARAEARKRIEQAGAALRRGESFGEAAKTYSDGLNAADGGSWGWVTRESVRERFLPAVDALEKLRPGEVSDVVETADGFFLVRCDDFDAGVEPVFQDVQPQLKERYFRNAFNRLIEEKVQQLRKSARIAPSNLDRFQAAVVEVVPAVLVP